MNSVGERRVCAADGLDDSLGTCFGFHCRVPLLMRRTCNVDIDDEKNDQ